MSNNSNNSTDPNAGQMSLPLSVPTTVTSAPSAGWHTTPYISIDFGVGGTICTAPIAEKKINKDGCHCKKCKEFYPFAETNQKDGTLICYSCRKGW